MIVKNKMNGDQFTLKKTRVLKASRGNAAPQRVLSHQCFCNELKNKKPNFVTTFMVLWSNDKDIKFFNTRLYEIAQLIITRVTDLSTILDHRKNLK